MKHPFLIILLVFLVPAFLFTQEGAAGQVPPKKFALVIGNGNYSGLTPLANPVNDANDIGDILVNLGFTVDKILNGSLEEMEEAVMRLKNRLSATENSYGFFFYAGHGVQSNGENYLIPVNANIPGENYLRNRAVSMQLVLDELNDARNSLNVIVLDACRDNPFGWSRSGSRGLSVVKGQPADSIVVYATSAGARASDGDDRNGLFTTYLKNNLVIPGIEVKEIFNRTGRDVSKASNNQQVPAIYSQFFGTAYFGDMPVSFEGQIALQPSAPAGPANQPATVIPNSGARDSGREFQREKFWSVGVSLGSAFAAPWLIGTAYGTLAPLKYSFLELGFDFGLINTAPEVDQYYSMYPFLHAAFFWPFTDKIGAYIGAGGGVWMVSYKFPDVDNYFDNYFVASFTSGAKFFDMLAVSYTLRTNFTGMSHKASIGYCYRFK